MKLAVIVPMLNEESTIAAALSAIRTAASEAQLIVVDGGSSDRSVEVARPRCDLLVRAARGRARQMNAGAAEAGGADALVFVHADTIVPGTFASDIKVALEDPRVVGGRFDIRLDDSGFLLRLTGALISARSRISRTGTGDQAIFVRRGVFVRMGGFPEIDLCEDLEFTRRLKRLGTIACLRSRVVSSARRWRREGFATTVFKMWSIRILFLAGMSPGRLKKLYADTR